MKLEARAESFQSPVAEHLSLKIQSMIDLAQTHLVDKFPNIS